MAKILIAYPPGPLYQRGEDRSQGNIENSTATSMRSANDLGYASSTLKKDGHETMLVDYQTENFILIDLLNDVKNFQPDFLFFSITNSTIFQDIEIANEVKKISPQIKIILKGSLFFDATEEVIKSLNLQNIDALIGGESDFIVSKLIKSLINNFEGIETVNGIFYKSTLKAEWKKTSFDNWDQDLDALPFPDRYAMNNGLYLRPDTGEPQATITTSRGCGAKCTYCLTPVISGTKIRYRSPENIYQELKECYHQHGIKNFFFKSDTFTMNKHWVIELCEKIYNSDLRGKIEWVANSRVNPLELETLKAMKKAGCWLVAFGFESGSAETLIKIRKGATIEHNIAARKMTKEAGLKCYGFFLVGLPWENMEHLNETKKHMFNLDCDFIELHIAVPYHGTNLYKEAKDAKIIEITPLGKDYFNSPTIGTLHLEMKKIMKFRKNLLLQYHLRPSYIFSRFLEALQKPKILFNYSKFAYKLLKNNS